jgi:hypothetical protein
MNKKIQLQEQQQLDLGPWWRQPWPWLLMLGPFVAIIGCVITMTLAFRNFSDQPVFDGGMKRGLVVERHVAKPPVAESR